MPWVSPSATPGQKLQHISTHPYILSKKEVEKMEIKCLTCGHRINLDHVVFRNYFGTVKCFTCSSMLEVKTKDGVLLGASLLAPRLYLKVRQKESRSMI
jgi:ribosomal protein S27E